MSEAVEVIYVHAFLHGVALHEMANCGYFLFSKALQDPKQLKQPLFVLCYVTFFLVVSQLGCLTAIIHWMAAGSKNSFAVQNAWFINTGSAATST
jgi:hypothetical protein